MRSRRAVTATLLILLPLALACDFAAAKPIETIRERVASVETPATHQPPQRGPTAAGSGTVSLEVEAIIGQLETVTVARREAVVEYRRSDWRHWIDADRDCQNTRAEALIEESRADVSFATADQCRVTAGEWVGPWSGEIFTDASDVDVDHHVPLAHAHISGGWKWDGQRKRDFANDLSNPDALQVTDASVNRSKGKQPPDQWRPEVRASWCRYAADWVSVKTQWSLTVTEDETEALVMMLGTCSEPGSWGLSNGP